jgi:hypothetical protein
LHSKHTIAFTWHFSNSHSFWDWFVTNIQARLRQFQVIGRKAPTAADANPPAYRMKLFATSATVAESRFWYFIHAVRKMKKATGEILDVNEVRVLNHILYLHSCSVLLVCNGYQCEHIDANSVYHTLELEVEGVDFV